MNLTATDLAGNVTNHTVDVTVTNVLEGSLPTITPTSATILSTAAAGTVVLDLPAKAEGETRSFLMGNPLAVDNRFAFSTAGKLHRWRRHPDSGHDQRHGASVSRGRPAG